MNRTPPIAVRRTLRKEVGFCCPVQGCGRPYLEWHHFDPTWSEKEHHNPEGMVALCRQHHIEADNGAFTVKQLRQFKNKPKAELDKARGKINWMRNKLLGFIGGGFYYETPIILQIKKERIIWFERDENDYLLLNITLPTTKGPLAVMRNNEWQNFFIEEDIECPPSAKRLNIKYPNDQHIKVSFFEIISYNDLVELNPRIEPYKEKIEVPITAVKVSYKIGNVHLSPKKAMINTNTFHMGLVSHGSVGFQIS